MAVGLLGFALVAANASLTLAIPWLRVGAWADTELAVAALHVCGALALAGLIFGMRTDPRVRSAATHPLTLLPFALAGWSLLGAVFAEFPGLALLGSPQTGQGVLWYLDLAAFTAAFVVVRTHSTAFRTVLGSLIAVAATATLINLRHFPSIQPLMAQWGVDPGWSLFAFNDYLVYYGIPLLIIGAAGLRTDRTISVVAMTTGFGALLAANNRTALVGAILVAIPTAVLWLLTRGERAKLLRSPALVACMAGAIGLVAVASYPLVRMVPQNSGLETLWSRAVLGRAVEPSLLSPKALLVGNGWGHYQQEMVRNIDSVGIRLFESEWRDMWRDEFHSHNAVLEAWLSAGLPGALLTIAIAMSMVVFAAPERRVIAWGAALYLSLMDALWFQMPTTLAAIAMATAMLAGERAPPRLGQRRLGAMVAAGSLLTVASVCGSALAVRHAIATDDWKRCLTAERPDSSCMNQSLPADPRQTGLGTAAILNELVPDATKQAATLAPERAVALHLAVAQAADRAPNSALSLALAVNNAFGLWLNAPAGSPLSLGPSDAARWASVIDHLQRVSPGRPDLTIPYVTWLLVTGRENLAEAVVARAEAGAPNHPVSLWFRGILSLGKQDERERLRGLTQLRAALRGGIERYMPVPSDVKAMLADSPQGNR